MYQQEQQGKAVQNAALHVQAFQGSWLVRHLSV